jgi:class 3 adenylate cyclase
MPIRGPNPTPIDTMSDFATWLIAHGLAKHVDTLRANDIDFDVLPSLTEAELSELGLSLGDRKRLIGAIADRQKNTERPPTEYSLTAPAAAPVPERRQLTIVFVDLVDSTPLSRALDPEDLRDLIRMYHQAVSELIREAGGFVAKFMGDGVLAYFGYPHASEDAAERAVKAGLRTLSVVTALSAPKTGALSSRVGIATGPVVVGDVTGEDIAREVNVVGETPSLAARLLSIGRPNGVIIAGSTRRLIGELFTLEELKPQVLKGLAEPVVAFQVTGERQGLSRFEAARRPHSSAFVGRAQEVGLLLDRWEQAKSGDSQLVLLSGEAGIGKSRITDTLWQIAAKGDYHRIRYQCSPQHINSPLYPAITQLAAVAQIQQDQSDEIRIEQLVSPACQLRPSSADARGRGHRGSEAGADAELQLVHRGLQNARPASG